MMETIQQNFLVKIQQMAEVEFQLACKDIKEEFPLNLSAVSATLIHELKQMMSVYKIMEAESQVEKLQYIYISYLRSSVLSCRPCYKIDFYDSRDRVSDVECTGNWSFEYVFNKLYEKRALLEKEFDKQTRAGAYELDRITYQLGERFHGIAGELFPSVIEDCLQEKGMEIFNGCTVNFLFGEYLDKSKKILTWDIDRVQSPVTGW